MDIGHAACNPLPVNRKDLKSEVGVTFQEVVVQAGLHALEFRHIRGQKEGVIIVQCIEKIADGLAGHGITEFFMGKVGLRESLRDDFRTHGIGFGALVPVGGRFGLARAGNEDREEQWSP